MQHENLRPTDAWVSGDAYQRYMGRWSRVVAREFLAWLDVLPHSRWLDVGSGTGTLSQTILGLAEPAIVHGVDRSSAYVAFAREHVHDERVQFAVGDAQALPVAQGRYDAVVSGLMLNFVSQPETAIAEMARATRQGGIVALYVWDYAGKMEFTRHFWDTAVALNPAVQALDQGQRFPLCDPLVLTEHFERTGLASVGVCALDIPTVFNGFDDYWTPFLGGQGAAPSYVMSLAETERHALRERLRISLPFAADGSLPLTARAWAVRGTR